MPIKECKPIQGNYTVLEVTETNQDEVKSFINNSINLADIVADYSKYAKPNTFLVKGESKQIAIYSALEFKNAYELIK